MGKNCFTLVHEEKKKMSNFEELTRPVFFQPGHNAGDLVESTQWKILREDRGKVEVEAHLPSHLLNPRGQLFGGFTGTYGDMISIYGPQQ